MWKAKPHDNEFTLAIAVTYQINEDIFSLIYGEWLKASFNQLASINHFWITYAFKSQNSTNFCLPNKHGFKEARKKVPNLFPNLVKDQESHSFLLSINKKNSL